MKKAQKWRNPEPAFSRAAVWLGIFLEIACQTAAFFGSGIEEIFF